MENVKGKYLFIVYSTNDESNLKAIKRHTEYIEHDGDIESITGHLFATTEGVTPTSFIEVYKLQARTFYPVAKK